MGRLHLANPVESPDFGIETIVPILHQSVMKDTPNDLLIREVNVSVIATTPCIWGNEDGLSEPNIVVRRDPNTSEKRQLACQRLMQMSLWHN